MRPDPKLLLKARIATILQILLIPVMLYIAMRVLQLLFSW